MIGEFRHRVTFQNPGPPVADGDGGFTQTWADLEPAEWFVSITPAGGADMERLAAGSVVSSATHVVRGRYHPGVTTATRMVLADGRVFAITGPRNTEERGIVMELAAAEMLGAP